MARYLIAVTLIASSLLIGCGPRSETSPSDGETATQEPLYRIAVIPMATTDVFSDSMERSNINKTTSGILASKYG